MLKRIKSIVGLLKRKANYRVYNKIHTLFPGGHFYSPIVDPADLKEREQSVWLNQDTMCGIDLHSDRQLELLNNAFRSWSASISYPIEQKLGSVGYFYNNDQFPALDAEVLYCMLCHIQPKHMIEVGSGFSSLITADVNRSKLGGKLDFSCIEPYPRQFLIDGVDGITSLVQKKVEDVDLAIFSKLQENDILFIDSSHVAKTGSDVNYLFFEILPRLNKGVLVHVHDIFLPDEYPKKWVIEECRNWNEQYLLHAFLQYNQAFEIVWASHFMSTRFHDQVHDVFPRFPSLGGGGSFWLRKVN